MSSVEEGRRSPSAEEECLASPEDSPSSSRATKRYGARSTTAPVSGGLLERLSLLRDAQGHWKERVQTSDVNQFTVEAKMKLAGASPVGRLPVLRSQSLRVAAPSLPAASWDRRPVQPVDVEAFFAAESAPSPSMALSALDLSSLSSEQHERLHGPVRARPQPRKQASKNPVKALLCREDVSSTYTERRPKSMLAESAVLGLAAKEDFASVALRPVSESTSPRLGTPDVLLLLVKGRRHVQLRVVSPSATALNSGDCYVLVAPAVVCVWLGAFANVLEQATARDLLLNKRKLGARADAQEVMLKEEAESDSDEWTLFWNLLGGKQPYAPAGPPDEDELFERACAHSFVAYGVDGERLKMLAWASTPSVQLLDEERALVLDFGAELYVWAGKRADKDERRRACLLAEGLLAAPFDFTAFALNPLSPLDDTRPRTGERRPSWTLLSKQSSSMASPLFRSKMPDWTDARSPTAPTSKDVAPAPPAHIDALPLVHATPPPVNLVLEGAALGRGDRWSDPVERRHYHVRTSDVRVWTVDAGVAKPVHARLGHVTSSECCVVQWKYALQSEGHRLGTGASTGSSWGRDRCAFFFWLGSTCPVAEQGLSALLTVQLDSERGPQLRVRQGYEPAAFLRLFAGGMLIQRATTSASSARLFWVRGEVAEEGCLEEVDALSASLRSRGCFVLVSPAGRVLLWQGRIAPEANVRVGQHCATLLLDRGLANVPMEPGVQLEHDGQESDEWRRWLSPRSPEAVSRPLTRSPRLFALSALAGALEATEVLHDTRSQFVAGMPFRQEILYEAAQPALFLLDAVDAVFVWQGWSPTPLEPAASARFHSHRRSALTLALDYARLLDDKPCPVSLVYAGFESDDFVHRFPHWTTDNEATRCHAAEGRTCVEDAETLLSALSRSRFSLDELMRRPLPEGVDPMRIEAYLDDKDFAIALGCDKDAFYSMPPWKQTAAKKDAALF